MKTPHILLNPTHLTCQLTIGNWPAAKGIQKLIGFSRGLGFHRVDYFPYFHHSNSIRLGYNRDSDISPIRLWNYAYIDGKHVQKEMGLIGVGVNLDIIMVWNNIACSIDLTNDGNTLVSNSSEPTGFKTLPIGVLLRPYAEIDGKENKRTPFEVDIKDLKVNGKLIKW